MALSMSRAASANATRTICSFGVSRFLFLSEVVENQIPALTVLQRLTYLTVISADALTRPNELRMVHSYRPASWLVIFLMNKLPLDAKRCLADGTIVFPSFRHFTSGDGFPSPWHGNSIVVPSFASMSNGSDMNRGLNDCFSPRHTKFPGIEIQSGIERVAVTINPSTDKLTRIRTLN